VRDGTTEVESEERSGHSFHLTSTPFTLYSNAIYIEPYNALPHPLRGWGRASSKSLGFDIDSITDIDNDSGEWCRGEMK